MIGGGFVDGFIEIKLPFLFIVVGFSRSELMLDWDGESTIFCDNSLHVEGESVVRIDLLFD